MSDKAREISNEELKRQLVSGTFGQKFKKRHLPTAKNLHKIAECLKKNLNPARTGKTAMYLQTMTKIKKDFETNPEIRRKYEGIRSIIQSEINALRTWELEMVRFGEKHPESMVINEASWHWQQDQFSNQYKFVHPRVRERNSNYQFIKHLKRFGNNKSVQKVRFLELYNEWKSMDPELKLLPWPTVGGDEVDLFELYRVVVVNGGLGRTIKSNKIWKKLGSDQRLHGTPDTLFYQLRIIYSKYLLSFEHKHQVAKGKSEEANCKPIKNTWTEVHESDDYGLDFEYLDEGERRKRKKRKRKRGRSLPIPMDSLGHELDDYSSDDVYYADPAQKRRKMGIKTIWQSHYGDDVKTAVHGMDTHNVFKSGSEETGGRRRYGPYWNGQPMIRALVMSLKSKTADSVNWALNRLLLLSYNTKSKVAEPFLVKHNVDLLDALISLLPYIPSVESKYPGVSHHDLSLELSSNHFGQSDVNIHSLRAIRNDTNSLLDPKLTRAVLRILSNLALTADNQQCMVDHPLLLPYLIEMTDRRDVVPSDCCFEDTDSDYSEIHIDAMRVIAHCSERINLAKWLKKVVPSKQPLRYGDKAINSAIDYKDERYEANSPEFVERLLGILARNFASRSLIGRKEYGHWIVYYSLVVCCRLAANPNNHGILSQYICSKKNVVSEDGMEVDNLSSKPEMDDGNLSKTLQIDGLDTSNLMVFEDKSKQKEYEWIVAISGHILSTNCQIKLAAIEALIYLFEADPEFTKYMFSDGHHCVVKEVITALVAVGHSDGFGHQMHRSASYLLSMMYKQCGDPQSQQDFVRIRARMFESCSQSDDFACYAIRLANVADPEIVN